jgi:hypothetical protein
VLNVFANGEVSRRLWVPSGERRRRIGHSKKAFVREVAYTSAMPPARSGCDATALDNTDGPGSAGNVVGIPRAVAISLYVARESAAVESGRAVMTGSHRTRSLAAKFARCGTRLAALLEDYHDPSVRALPRAARLLREWQEARGVKEVGPPVVCRQLKLNQETLRASMSKPNSCHAAGRGSLRPSAPASLNAWLVPKACQDGPDY